MGYTHYEYYDIIKSETMQKISEDFIKLLPVFQELGLDLANGNGTGNPTITKTALKFNGRNDCGHAKEDLGIMWPADKAADIETFADNRGIGTQQTAQQLVKGQWFGGALLEKRTCGGDCSHEPFYLEVTQLKAPERISKYSALLDQEGDATENLLDNMKFNCTKTAFKPYDLAVQCALIIARHHSKIAGNNFFVVSDGGPHNWGEAVYICFSELGIMDFHLFDREEYKKTGAW